MIELLLHALNWFVPPKIDATPERQYWWRVRVGVVTCAGFSGLCLFAAASFGLVHGIDSFVRSSELSVAVQGVNNNIAGLKNDVTNSVTELKKDRDSDTIDRLKAEMINLNETHCNTKPGPARTLYANQLSAMQDRYAQLTSRNFPLPACSDL